MVSEQLVQQFLMGSKQSQSGQRRLELLNRIASLGSLSAAAKACGMSYKGAWQAVEAMNQLAGIPLVDAQKGGIGGGGMELTSAGQSLLNAYLLFSEQMNQWLQSVNAQSPELLNQMDLMRKFSMKTSARNLFHGTVKQIEQDSLNCEVTLQISPQQQMVASITPNSLERLGLEEGSDVFALIKSSWVIVTEEVGSEFKTSARNQFHGVVSHLTCGELNCEVDIRVGEDLMLAAMVSRSSVEALQLQPGQACCAWVKASHVLLAVTD